MKRKTKQFTTAILYDIMANDSKLNPGSDVYTMHFVDENLKKYEVSVDPTYFNFKNWTLILNSKNPYGIYENLILTDRKTNKNVSVISADSRAVKVHSMSIDQIYDWIEEQVKTTNGLFKF